MTRPQVIRPADIATRERGNGVRTKPMVSATTGSTSFLNGITEFDPGAAVPLHYHNCQECVLVLDGRAVAQIDGIDFALGPNDATFIPAGVHHFFRNPSQSEKLRICWTYATLDADRTIVATGVTTRIDQEHGGQ